MGRQRRTGTFGAAAVLQMRPGLAMTTLCHLVLGTCRSPCLTLCAGEEWRGLPPRRATIRVLNMDMFRKVGWAWVLVACVYVVVRPHASLSLPALCAGGCCPHAGTDCTSTTVRQAGRMLASLKCAPLVDGAHVSCCCRLYAAPMWAWVRPTWQGTTWWTTWGASWRSW